MNNNRVSPGSGGGGSGESNVQVADIQNIPGWLRSGLAQLDEDGDGLEQEEMEEMLSAMAAQKKAKREDTGELDYRNMPPKVQEVLQEWDQDGGGTVSVAELLRPRMRRRR